MSTSISHIVVAKLVASDVMEVSPPYDTDAETTSIAAADLIVDVLALVSKSRNVTEAPV